MTTAITASVSLVDLTLEERLRGVAHRLRLIHAAALAADDEMTIEPDDLMEAVFTATTEALDLLEPVRSQIPAAMANWTPANGASLTPNQREALNTLADTLEADLRSKGEV